MNAYFRWKNKEDTSAGFTMELWITVYPVYRDFEAPIMTPDTATTDVTLRCLQQFKIQPGRSYTWYLTQDGHSIASGQVIPDIANLLIMPKVPLSTHPAELSIK